MTAPQNTRVTQVDKQAAEAFWMVHGPFAWGTVATLYEAFARHREAAEAEAGAREAALVEALEVAHAAMAEYYRYWTGGETRGSYDGKPERNALWNAMHKTRAALTKEPDA